MGIFELTYLSDELLVKAYLGIPSAIRVQRDDILTLLIQRYGHRPDLSVEVVEGAEDEEKDRVPVSEPLPGLVYCRGGPQRSPQGLRCHTVAEAARLPEQLILVAEADSLSPGGPSYAGSAITRQPSFVNRRSSAIMCPPQANSHSRRQGGRRYVPFLSMGTGHRNLHLDHGGCCGIKRASIRDRVHDRIR